MAGVGSKDITVRNHSNISDSNHDGHLVSIQESSTVRLQRFSIRCRKTKRKVRTLTNHNRRKQRNEPISTRIKYSMWPSLRPGHFPATFRKSSFLVKKRILMRNDFFQTFIDVSLFRVAAFKLSSKAEILSSREGR